MELVDKSLGLRVPDVSENDFFDSLEQLKNGFAIYDTDLNLIFANKTVRSYLPILYANFDAGLSLVESITLQVQNFYPELNIHECQGRAASIVEAIKNEATMEVTASNGRIIKSEYKKLENGHYILVSTDVTQHVRNEKALAKAQQDAESADQAKTEFLANMSHEIRTPLSGVFMAAQLLQQELLTLNHPRLTGLADILVGSTGHLNEIINNVLDLSKIEAGQIDILRTNNSLTDMLQKLNLSQTHVANKKGIDLNLVIDANLPKILRYDILRVRQCVLNLVTNALKFTTVGSITVAVLFDPQTYIVKIHVADTGVGVPTEEQAQVFDHFVQIKQEASNPHIGTGLGLPISRKLARLMGGDIVLTSEFGKGSIFTLTFTCEQSCTESDKLAAVA